MDRRRFLKYVGAGATTLVGAGVFGGALTQLGCSAAPNGGWVRASGEPLWTPPAYPVPLPSDRDDRAQDKVRLATYEVIDDLTLPAEFRYDVIAKFGDRVGKDGHGIFFGYNNDYTGLLPIKGSTDEYWLFVNHEYLSYRPFFEACGDVFDDEPPNFELREDVENDPPRFFRGVLHSGDWHAPLGSRVNLADEDEMAAVPDAVKADIQRLSQRMLDQMGVSILRVRRLADGRFEVVKDASDHRRISGMGRQNIDAEARGRSGFTGPASTFFAKPPAGTMSNCSGGTTPWGTFLTCEENFYTAVEEDITPEGQPIAGQAKYFGARTSPNELGLYVFDSPVPPSIGGIGHAFGLDGREYGWVTEVEPETGAFTKHTALGRFRHENVALRCEAGEPLAAYMGDDRRGGHVWKFVSDDVVEDPKNPDTRRLLEKGTLYVARFTKDGEGDDARRGGEWVPLTPETPLRAPEPEHCFSQHVQVPARFVGGAVAVGDTDRDRPDIEVEYWQEIVESFTGKKFSECTLGDLVKADGESAEEIREKKLGVILMDAFLMANACGGTPAARPEDLEVHPQDNTVFIAFTDNSDGSDGSPDLRIFPHSRLDKSLQYGAVYR
ncbi:MAG: alkaline phosphatase PhoX, partial [Acidobacteriota bacterium]